MRDPAPVFTALTLSALALAACGKSADSTDAHPPASAPLEAGAPQTDQEAAVETAPVVTSAPVCAVADLGLEAEGSDAGAGQRATTFAAVNKGRGVCALSGFPKITVLAGGQPRGDLTVEEHPGPTETVTVGPGGRARFSVLSTAISGDGQSEPCPTADAVALVGDDGTRSGEATYGAQPCGGRVHVTAWRSRTNP